MNNVTKGFITVATGDYYCKLAIHLYMTYKLFGCCSYPFYVITDNEGEKQLKDFFDGIIKWDGFTKTSVDKLIVFTCTPFDETIFIDADSSIVNDIGYLFDLFEKNGSDISAISRIKFLEKDEKGIQFGLSAIRELNLMYDFPKFNGGVYYYKKTDFSKETVSFMMNQILPNYHKYDLLGRNNSTNMGDEPVVIATMITKHLRTIPLETNAMYLVQNAKKVKWNFQKKICKFKFENKIVSPTIIHWKVGGTETFNYEKYDARINGFYYKQSFFVYKKKQIISFIKFYIYPILLKIFPSIRNKVIKLKQKKG